MSAKTSNNPFSMGQIEADLFVADSAIKKAETMTSKAGDVTGDGSICHLIGRRE